MGNGIWKIIAYEYFLTGYPVYIRIVRYTHGGFGRNCEATGELSEVPKLLWATSRLT